MTHTEKALRIAFAWPLAMGLIYADFRRLALTYALASMQEPEPSPPIILFRPSVTNATWIKRATPAQNGGLSIVSSHNSAELIKNGKTGE